MGVFFLRILLLFIVLLAVALSVPSLRRRLFDAIRRRDSAELKKNVIIALLVYFFISVYFTLQDCSDSSSA